jgi:hypothetical protein
MQGFPKNISSKNEHLIISMLESSVEIIAIARTKKRVTGIKNNKTQYL